MPRPFAAAAIAAFLLAVCFVSVGAQVDDEDDGEFILIEDADEYSARVGRQPSSSSSSSSSSGTSGGSSAPSGSPSDELLALLQPFVPRVSARQWRRCGKNLAIMFPTALLLSLLLARCMYGSIGLSMTYRPSHRSLLTIALTAVTVGTVGYSVAWRRWTTSQTVSFFTLAVGFSFLLGHLAAHLLLCIAPPPSKRRSRRSG
eukprot:TRINITY_DN45536_c0_g1_i1.p1 TRINITY_DN45536_c0_g1~~TRINITY_DN45536_c0_g1_i1.p1  ORF type:complete len:202 (-),score=21.72 TRINITY_DN45536_c0_g1_i1:119-724(-)